jgi:hypothetical protein
LTLFFDSSVINGFEQVLGTDVSQRSSCADTDDAMTTPSISFAQNKGAGSSPHSLPSPETRPQDSIDAGSDKSSAQFEIALNTVIKLERMQSPPLNPNPRTPPTVIDPPKDLTPQPNNILSMDVEHNTDFGESGPFDEFGFLANSGSPVIHGSSSTKDAETVCNSAVQASQKRRLSEGDSSEAIHHSKVARRAGNETFREVSPESASSSTNVESGYRAKSSNSVSEDLQVSTTPNSGLAELELDQTSQSSKDNSPEDYNEHHLLKPDHLDKLYTLEADRYFCHACLYVVFIISNRVLITYPKRTTCSIRSEKTVDHSHKLYSVSFPKTVLSHVLIHHYEKEHADTCKKFIALWSRVCG